MKSRNIDNSTIEAVEASLKPLYCAVFRLMIGTGLRVGDAVACRYSDIDTNGYLHYTAEKTGKKARVRVPDDILKYIGWTEKRSKSKTFIFPSPKNKGNHISRQAVWKNIKKACIRAGVSPNGISPHTCRKHYAVELFRREGLGTTMNALQHSSPSTTFLYVYGDDPISVFENRITKLERLIEKLTRAVDMCLDALIGDTTVNLTDEYLNSLQK